MYYEDLQDIRYELEEEGEVVIEHLKSEVLYEKGGYGVMLFLYRRKNNPEEVTIMRFKKKQGVWKRNSKINMGGAENAKKIIEILKKWFEE